MKAYPQCNTFPFRGKAGMGVGSVVSRYPTPILTFPLKGKEFSLRRKFLLLIQ